MRPLLTFALCAGVLSVWAWGYEAVTGHAPRLHAEAPAERATAVAPERAHPSPRLEEGVGTDRAPTAGRALGPRLLGAVDPDAPGLPIAIEDADGHSMDRLKAALSRAALGEGQARIVFYGASHVASDFFTHVIRTELQERVGNAGHGFILPAQPWPRYRHLGIEVSSNYRRWTAHRIRANSGPDDLDRYGLAGVAVESSRPGAWGEVKTDGESTASLFDLYYLKQPRGGDFDVVIDGKRVERVKTAGATMEAGYATYRVEDGAHAFRVRTVGNGNVRLFGVAVEREVPGVIVDTLGVNGARARAHLLWEDALYREHLRRRNPDLVVLAYGTNESGDDSPIERYEEELTRVVSRVRETVPDASCLLIGPSDRPIQVEADEDGQTFEDRPRTGELIRIQHNVALEQGCGFFDLVAFQGGPLSMVEWSAADPPFGAPDHIHYTVRGYHRLGTVLLGALLEGWERPRGAAQATGAVGMDNTPAQKGISAAPVGEGSSSGI